MKDMHKLKEMLCREVDEIQRKGDLSAGDLETLHKLTDTIKNIDKIEMMEEDGYSRDDGYSQNGEWEARGRFGHGNSYARRRDRRGRYSRDDGMEYSQRGYSRDEDKDELVDELKEMMKGASGRNREIIRKAMEEIKSA